MTRYKARVSVLVPHYAMSGGTLIALAADETLMDTYAVLGPVDPRLGEYPAVSIFKVVERKKTDEIDDRILILADIAEKARRQVYIRVREILISHKMEAEKADQLAQILTEGRWTHDYPISYEEAVELGLPVRDSLPEEVLILMSLYPQPPQRRPLFLFLIIPFLLKLSYRDAKRERRDNRNH